MSKSVNKFHYVNEDGKDTSPEMATRITLLVYNEKQKISKRVDWKRDDANTSEDCCLQLEKDDNEVMFTRTDAIENMKEVIAKLMDDLRRTGSNAGRSGSIDEKVFSEISTSHKIQDLAKLLIDANKKLDDMIQRIFTEGGHVHCTGDHNHEE